MWYAYFIWNRVTPTRWKIIGILRKFLKVWSLWHQLTQAHKLSLTDYSTRHSAQSNTLSRRHSWWVSFPFPANPNCWSSPCYLFALYNSTVIGVTRTPTSSHPSVPVQSSNMALNIKLLPKLLVVIEAGPHDSGNSFRRGGGSTKSKNNVHV